MLWHRQAIFESKGDKLSSSAESRIWTQGVSETQSSADWMPADKPTELSRIKLKNLNSTARPYDQQAFSPPDPTAIWHSHLALAIYIFVVVNFDALAQASDFRIERRQVVFLCWEQDSNPGGLWNPIFSRLNACWQTDWAIEDQAKKLELDSPSLWSNEGAHSPHTSQTIHFSNINGNKMGGGGGGGGWGEGGREREIFTWYCGTLGNICQIIWTGSFNIIYIHGVNARSGSVCIIKYICWEWWFICWEWWFIYAYILKAICYWCCFTEYGLTISFIPVTLFTSQHDDVIKWKHFPRYSPFVRGIHRSRWIPRTKASDAGLWYCLWSAPE